MLTVTYRLFFLFLNITFGLDKSCKKGVRLITITTFTDFRQNFTFQKLANINVMILSKKQFKFVCSTVEIRFPQKKQNFLDIHRMKSHLSVDWMAGTFQWPFSQLILWKIKLHSTLLEPVSTNQRESTLTIRPQGPINTMMNI